MDGWREFRADATHTLVSPLSESVVGLYDRPLPVS